MNYIEKYLKNQGIILFSYNVEYTFGTKFCKDNNIKLFRIKYDDNLKESVQDILDFIKNKKF